MADIQLNSVTLATETGGTVTLDSGVQDNITRLGTVTVGTIGSVVTMPTGNEKLQVVQSTKDQVGVVASGNELHRVTFTPTRQSTKQTWFWQLAHRSSDMGALNALSGGHMYLGSSLYNNTDSTWVQERLSGYGHPPNMAQTYNCGTSGIGASAHTLSSSKEYAFILYIKSSGASTVNTNASYGEYGPDVILIGQLWE